MPFDLLAMIVATTWPDDVHSPSVTAISVTWPGIGAASAGSGGLAVLAMFQIAGATGRCRPLLQLARYIDA
ncbi:MAG: hypothetical protein ACI9S9_004284 [Planctomycetota bacterium]|jgi:hypothetical protein